MDTNEQAGGSGGTPRIVLGPNQYGKAEVRLVKVSRGTVSVLDKGGLEAVRDSL